MIEVCNLVKRYGEKIAVNDISFNINEGEIVGLLGQNGAGKSTTMNIISGYIMPTTGSIYVNKFDILKNPIKAKAQIGYLPEHPPLYSDMTVRGYLNFMYDLKKVKRDKQRHIDEICDRVGILDVCNRPIKRLSKGYQQRIGIAQALLGYPPLIILDEPTVGLDPKQIISIRNLIKDLSQSHTIIFSSHILYEVQMLCDRIIIIDSGKVIADKSTNQLMESIEANRKLIVHVEGDRNQVETLLGSIDGVVQVDSVRKIDGLLHEYILECGMSNDIRKNIFKGLVSQGLSIVKFDSVEINLEDAFLKLIDKFSSKTTDNETKDSELEENKFTEDEREKNSPVVENDTEFYNDSKRGFSEDSNDIEDIDKNRG